MKIIQRSIATCNANAQAHLDLANSKIHELVWARIEQRHADIVELSEQSRKHLHEAWMATELPAILRQVWIELRK